MKNQNLDYFNWVMWPLFPKGNKNTAPDCSPESYGIRPFCTWREAVTYLGRRNSDGDPNPWSSVELWSNWYRLLRHHNSSLKSQTCIFLGAQELQASQKGKLVKYPPLNNYRKHGKIVWIVGGAKLTEWGCGFLDVGRQCHFKWNRFNFLIKPIKCDHKTVP